MHINPYVSEAKEVALSGLGDQAPPASTPADTRKATVKNSAFQDDSDEIEAPTSPKKKAAKPAFVELIEDHSATITDCVIEFESSVGGKMRIQWKASTAPDWISLFRAWRESER